MEGLQEQQNFSDEQQEKIAELLPIVKEKFDSFTNSDEAYETADSINRLYKYLKDQDLNPKDYYLWSLLSPDNSSVAEYTKFDTDDGDIETFIRTLPHTEAEE